MSNSSLMETTPITDNEVNVSQQIGLEITAWVLIVIAVCGVLGNILGAAVLHRMQKTNNNVRLLKYLSLVDIALLILFVLGLLSYFPNNYATRTLHTIFHPFAYLLGMAVYTFEIYLTVLIAIQRCTAIVLPLNYRSLMRASVINTILGCIAVFTVAVNVPLWLAAWPRPYWDRELNMQLYYGDPTTSPFGLDGYKIYIGPVMVVFRCIIPLIILVTCNILLVVSRRRRMNSANPQSSDRGSVKLTMLVMAITTMSVITHIVSAVNRLLYALDSSTVIVREELNIVSLLLVVLNSSTNFIFYYAFGKTFQEILKSCFRSNE